jgi:hypothetical protein
MLPKFKLKKNNLLIAYKLLFDLLLGILILFIASIFAEGILPGIITSHVSFSQMVFLLSFVIFLIYLCASLAGIEEEKMISTFKNKKTAFILPIFLGLIFANRLLGINVFLMFSILAVSTTCAWFVFRVLKDD